MHYKEIPFEQLEPLQKVFMSTLVKDELDTFVYLSSTRVMLAGTDKAYRTVRFYKVKEDCIWSGIYMTFAKFKVSVS